MTKSILCHLAHTTHYGPVPSVITAFHAFYFILYCLDVVQAQLLVTPQELAFSFLERNYLQQAM
jgi:hypothetical protein